ncbi:hypothetical protein BDM02DRAFT_3187667 [Thelephora ganbajun]|uniref:Uncharacterized protein n=1 Tax=Thelephora ganbajun TaxID=370292 RepID=A0ACB6ZE48_THEGA|nr:hypothetical protein BDM02DRAFT_3187667 [Thelephora ganbajun]
MLVRLAFFIKTYIMESSFFNQNCLVDKDEEDDDSTSQSGPPQIPMEVNDKTDGVNTGAYTCLAGSLAEGFDQAHPMIPNSPTHDLDVFHRCRRDPRNIVLDSVQPGTVPHIVITPPEFDWADLLTMQENAAPLQQHPEYYLCVPGSGPTSLLATVTTERAGQEVQAEISIADSVERENDSLPNDAALVNNAQAMRVFSPSLFTGIIEAASQERELMPRLLRSLYKRLFSTCAAAASNVAHNLRSRYSSSTAMPELFSRLETPITWSDPASPLLSFFRQLPGTLIIDSVTPFTIPHIIISEPPIWDYNPYVNMHNSTQSPQDAGWGQSLVVLSPVVDFVNLPEEVPPELGESTSGYSTIAQYAESEGEGDMWEPDSPSEGSVVGSPASTAFQTPGLLTPIDEEEEFDLMIFSPSPPRDSQLSPVEGGDLMLEDVPQDVEMFCDDEDDLPPLDSWYQDIAARSGYVLST